MTIKSREMENIMGEQFLKLKKYFEELDKDKAVDYFENVPFIRMEWLFSEILDRSIIKEVIAKIMSNLNPKYIQFSGKQTTMITNVETKEKYYERHYPEDIQGFRVILQESEDRLILQAVGADNHTKLNISNKLSERDNQEKGQIRLITLEEFAQVIANELDIIQLEEVLKNLKLEANSIDTVKRKFLRDEQIHARNLERARKGLEQLFKNAVQYYRYLVEYKSFLNKKEEKIDMTYIVEQRKDEGEKKGKKIKPETPRVNEIIEFMERADILNSLGPSYTRVLGEKIEETDEIVLNSYTVFAYTNVQMEAEGNKADGWLFVCEPQRGDRSTRLMFLTREEFESFEIGEDDDRVSAIAKHYLDKSQSEFDTTKGTLTLKHTSIENFTRKMKFYIIGIKPKIGHITSYIKNLRRLYDDLELTPHGYKARPRRKKEELMEAISDIPESQVDDTVQKAINGKEQNTQYQE